MQIKGKRKTKDQKYLKGYNTDVFGFTESFKPLINTSIYKKALILGTGGASKAVSYSLHQLNIEFTLVSRKPYTDKNTISYSDINEIIMNEHLIIINTTPLGMHPEVNFYPDIPYDMITSDHIIYDLIYNPSETQFLKFGKFNNAKTKNGLEMLQLQAEKSWEIFNC